MDGLNPTSFPDEQKLAQTALDHVRAVFKGNGIKQDSITILSQQIAHYTLNAGTYLELRPQTTERTTPGRSAPGQSVPSREEATRQIDQAMVVAARNPAFRAQVADILLRRPDQGFGLVQETVPLDFLKREYSWQEACDSCRGNAQAPCSRCQGRRTEPCIKCSGRTLMACPVCRTSGLAHGAKCTRCNGQRYVPCDQCHHTGMMPCRICQGRGVSQCTVCGGQGWTTHTLTLSASALTYFEYDAKSVPKGAADRIETEGAELAREAKIKVRGRIADGKENILGASYEVSFPYGEVVFQIGKKEVKANLFGGKADITEFPYVLDKLLAPVVEDLEEAAKDIGSVAAKIRAATRYRLIAQAFLHAGRTNIRKTAEQLLKTYDIGLSSGMAYKIATLANGTALRITRKPRYYGLAIGLIIGAAVSAAYYLLPLRSKIAAYLPDPRFDAVLDILPLILGGMITTAAIQISAAGAMKRALGHLLKNNKNTIAPKAGAMGIWGYVLTCGIMLGIMEIAAVKYSSAPYWYEMLRNVLTQTL